MQTDLRLTICDRCGEPLGVGDWPFCPHGKYAGTVIGDEIPGGVVLENLGPEPVRVYSETERRRIMKERGLREYVRDSGGSWNTVSQTSLDNARSLLDPARRRARHDASDPGADAVAAEAQVETLDLTVTQRADGFRVAPDGEPHT
jgi:hypothetical protein